MGFVADIKAFLDSWDDWKEVRAATAKVPALEARIAELENKLGGKWPADVCPKCGERAMRATGDIRGGFKDAYDRWECSSCDYNEPRAVGRR